MWHRRRSQTLTHRHRRGHRHRLMWTLTGTSSSLIAPMAVVVVRSACSCIAATYKQGSPEGPLTQGRGPLANLDVDIDRHRTQDICATKTYFDIYRLLERHIPFRHVIQQLRPASSRPQSILEALLIPLPRTHWAATRLEATQLAATQSLVSQAQLIAYFRLLSLHP